MIKNSTSQKKWSRESDARNKKSEIIYRWQSHRRRRKITPPICLTKKLQNVTLWDLSPEAQEEAGHALAKSLLGGA